MYLNFSIIVHTGGESHPLWNSSAQAHSERFKKPDPIKKPTADFVDHPKAVNDREFPQSESNKARYKDTLRTSNGQNGLTNGKAAAGPVVNETNGVLSNSAVESGLNSVDPNGSNASSTLHSVTYCKANLRNSSDERANATSTLDETVTSQYGLTTQNASTSSVSSSQDFTPFEGSVNPTTKLNQTVTSKYGSTTENGLTYGVVWS
ncbi:hypothetical protein TTRE_0000477101 [Trichuris trichiura]|uniref:Uncharacterized protein n=1 Tax=Trichuris trichiura TaxID=36087 RepID=A0A077Z8E8_TRITR|nr:hypothetical protein TTRE_0000477101 [Trichuris trichiura]